MLPRISIFKFIDLSMASMVAFSFIFLPVSHKSAPSAVLSITTPLYIPIERQGSVTAPDFTARSIMVIDPDSGTTIFEKNIDEKLYPASTTKLMTALVALDAYYTDEVLTVKSGSSAVGSKIDLSSGEKMTVENLLYGLLVDSGNDAGVVLAENYETGYTGFISAMNQKAKELGLTNTHFTNVSGLINPDHYTSTRDLTKIARLSIQNALIRKIVSTQQITISDVSGKISHYLESTNKLLGLDGVKGLKTGWTPESGECLVTLVTRDHKSIIITVLGSQDRFSETKKIIDWVYENYDWKTI